MPQRLRAYKVASGSQTLMSWMQPAFTYLPGGRKACSSAQGRLARIHARPSLPIWWVSPLSPHPPKLGGGDEPRGFSGVLLTVYTAGLRYTEHCGHPRVPGGQGAALMAVCWPR